MAIPMSRTSLPPYLRAEQERIESAARSAGLDFFPVIFEMLSYDQVNEIAAYGGFPNRYPHWRFGMEYERLSKSNEYGLTKIYEMVINNTPAVAYLLEGNSLTDQKFVMSHVYGHVDFFKNNFAFRATDLNATGKVINPVLSSDQYRPNRKWIDRIANHGATVRRIIDRKGMDEVEKFIDSCLSLENLIDPHSPFMVRHEAPREEEEDPRPVEVPRLRAKSYMDKFINPDEYIQEQRTALEAKRKSRRDKFPREPVQAVLGFLLNHAPLERWERAILAIIQDEAYYFSPQIQTKIMNEGWASYWHSKLMSEGVCTSAEIIDYADTNAAVLATSRGQLNPYKLGVELFRSIEERWNRGQFGRAYEECDDLDRKRNWDQRLGLGREKIFEVRRLYSDVTFIDEFLTPEFAMEHQLFNFEWSKRHEQYEIATREFKKVKEKLLTQLTNLGSPFIYVDDANHENRGELLLTHAHRGIDLRGDYAQATLTALARVWKRPVCLRTALDGKPTLLRFDGKEHTSSHEAASA
jgi:stage V sporulation protein R